MEVGVQHYAPAAGPPRKIPGTHCTAGGPRVSMDGVKDRKSIAYTALRSLDHPARSESLYRLRDSDPFYFRSTTTKFNRKCFYGWRCETYSRTEGRLCPPHCAYFFLIKSSACSITVSNTTCERNYTFMF